MPRPTTLGERIRTARLVRHLTLGQVAEKVGVSVSALSQLERDQFNPTIATLKAIATTLDTTIGRLVAEASTLDRAVVRAGERKRLSPRRGITYQLLTPDLSGHVELILSDYEVGAGTGEEAFAYHAEQCGIVLQGLADVQLGDTVHRLRAGDSIRFDCSIPHRITNVGRGRLRCLWAISPPTF
jgi:transcriptional regulator with XRE-family HTH domain